ncbi:MAG: FIST N-terminal domain-containing protein [Planctomycetota bacterium]
MIRRARLVEAVCVVAAVALVACGCGSPASEVIATPPPTPAGDIVIEVAAAQDEDAYAAGKAAAEALQRKLGDAAPHLVLITECFDQWHLKSRALKGVAAVFPRDILCGAATYGVFTQAGCLDRNAIGLVALAGSGLSVSGALQPDLGTASLVPGEDDAEIQQRLNAAGARLALRVPNTPQDKLMIVLADAHSPKNAHLVEGLQTELGKGFPITGGCANKNAGQTYVYYQGRMYRDSAVGIMLGGGFQVAMAGRMAKTNRTVVASAKEGAAEAVKKLEPEPFAAFAFNCAGRKGKLDNIQTELDAIQQALGKTLPLYGCYCAGEIGPADLPEADPDALSSGVGWHVMFTLLGR